MHSTRTIRTTAICLTALALAGCQAIAYGTAADFNHLRLGMSHDEVLAALGTPLSTEADAGRSEQRLVYKRMASVTSWGPSYYAVVLKHGRVAQFGERR